MRTRVIVVGLLLVAVLAGCKKSAIETTETTDDTAALVDAQQATTAKLDEIRGQIASLRNAAAAQRAEPDFLFDLAAATRLAGKLSAQASKQEADEASYTVQRLIRCLAGLVASAPANRIQRHLERAEVSLSAGDLAAATEDILAAAGEAYNPTAPALVPEVLSQLEEASVALDGGDAPQAAGLVAKVMEATLDDPTAEDLSVAHLTAVDAAEAVERKAWDILRAQATEIGKLLKAVDKRAAPEAKPETPPAEPATTTAAPATPAATTQPESATPPASSAAADAETGKPEETSEAGAAETTP